MFLDKLLKKKKNADINKPSENSINERPSGDMPEESYNITQTAFEKPDLDFIGEDHSIDDMLKDLGLVNSDAPMTAEEKDRLIQSMLTAANDVLGEQVDLDALMEGKIEDETFVDALKESLGSPKDEKVEIRKPSSSHLFSSQPLPEEYDDEPAAVLDEYDMLFGGTGENLDDLISAALERDKIAGQESSFEDVARDFVNDTAVYQKIDRNSETTYQKPKSKLDSIAEGLDPKILRVVLAALGVLIVTAAAIGAFVVMQFGKSNSASRPGGFVVSQAKGAINNANYIYVNTGLEFKKEPLIINKMLIDSLCSAFYFNKALDTANLDITLRDENGRVYAPDLAFMLNAGSSNTSELRFQPLSERVGFFFLNIKDLQTGDEVEFEFALDNSIAMPEAKFLGRSKDMMSSHPSFSAHIDGLSFSSAGSRMDFSLSWSGESAEMQLGRKNGAQVISMTEDGRLISPIKNDPALYYFEDENIILGRMDFVALRSLDGKITVKFTDLYQKYEINERIAAGRLFRYKTEEETELELGNYKLVLERAGWQGNKLILVCHVEASNIYAVSGAGQDSDNRVEILMDVSVQANMPDGPVMLDGRCISSAMGTDIIFEAGERYDKIRSVSFDSYEFIISNVYIKNEDLEFSYDLSSARRTRPASQTAAENALIGAFEKRLAFKSGALDIFDVTGFSGDLADTGYLMKEYAPVYTEDVIYSAQIITMSIADDTAHAVIAEYWKGVVDGKPELILNVHKAKMLAGGDGWTVVEDEIIKS